MPFDGTKLDETTQRLIRGRARIEQGWCKGALYKDGAVCAIGAIMDNPSAESTAPNDKIFGTAYDRLSKAVGSEWIASWNNQRARTKEDVLAAFDRAISS
jgi:hypothetical protein